MFRSVEAPDTLSRLSSSAAGVMPIFASVEAAVTFSRLSAVAAGVPPTIASVEAPDTLSRLSSAAGQGSYRFRKMKFQDFSRI